MYLIISLLVSIVTGAPGAKLAHLSFLYKSSAPKFAQEKSTAPTGDHTILIDAAAKGDMTTVKALLDKGVDINAKNKECRTALYQAAANGHTDIVRVLLDRRAGVNAQAYGWTALTHAAANGHVDIVQALLEAKADVNVKSEDGWTALIGAAANDHTEIVRMLLEKGADVNAKQAAGAYVIGLGKVGGYTALMWAAREAHIKMVKVLLAAGANVNAKNIKGGTALTLAAHEWRSSITLEPGAQWGSMPRREDRVETVRLLKKAGAKD